MVSKDFLREDDRPGGPLIWNGGGETLSRQQRYARRAALWRRHEYRREHTRNTNGKEKTAEAAADGGSRSSTDRDAREAS